MPDPKTEALTVQSSTSRQIVKHKQKEDEFVPKVKIKMTDSSIMVVPANAEANKNQSIILAEIARNFVTDQMKLYITKGRVLTPQEIKELVTAAKLANEMSIVAHEEIMTPTDTGGKRSNSQAGMMLKAVEAAAKGVTTGNIEAQARALEKFRAMGEKKTKVIDVEATVVP